MAETERAVPTEREMRDNVVRLAFGGDERRFLEFCGIVRDAVARFARRGGCALHAAPSPLNFTGS